MDESFKKYFALSIIILLGIFILYMLKGFLTPIFIAVVLSYLFYPLYKYFLKKTGDKKTLSSLGVIFVILIIILVPLSGLASVMLNEFKSIDFSEEKIAHYEDRIYDLTGFEFSISENVVNLQDRLRSEAESFLLSLISFTTNFLLSVFIMFFVMYYIFIDKDRIIAFLISIMPFSKEGSVHLLNNSSKLISAILIGQFLTAVVQGLLGMFSFYVAGIQGAFFWGIVMIILSIIPVVGAFLVWLPAGIFLIVEGQVGWGIFILLWGALVVSQIDNIIRPKFVNRFAKIHPLEIFIGVIMGISFFGIIGLVIGPLIIALFGALLKEYRREYGEAIKNEK